MSCLTDIFKDIENDFSTFQYEGKLCLSRRRVLENKCNIILYLYRNDLTREVAIELQNDYKEDEIKGLPKWKGMEQRLCSIQDNGKEAKYLVFEQLKEYESYIFEVVLNDLLENIGVVQSKDILYAMNGVLSKWKQFFQIQLELVMTEVKQQGLYTELILLERLIKWRGAKTVMAWTGCEAETHDFYLDSNAIEVKSSSAKGPFKVTINSEYQLDNQDVIGILYILFISIRKSKIDGEKLPDIVERIEKLLGASSNFLNEFKSKLLKYGYLIDYPELYKVCFNNREELYYKVEDGFPKITTRNIPKGIGNIEYTVSLDACKQYQITNENFHREIGVNTNDN